MEVKLGQEKEGMFEFIKTKEQKFFFLHSWRKKQRKGDQRETFFFYKLDYFEVF